MAKAHLTLPNGTKVNIEGSADEVAILLKKCSQSTDIANNGRNSTGNKKVRPLRTRQKGTRKEGPTIFITQLENEGYFKSKRTLLELQKKLEERGHIYAQTSISPALTRLTRKRTIRRIKEKKNWVYIS